MSTPLNEVIPFHPQDNAKEDAAEEGSDDDSAIGKGHSKIEEFCRKGAGLVSPVIIHCCSVLHRSATALERAKALPLISRTLSPEGEHSLSSYRQEKGGEPRAEWVGSSRRPDIDAECSCTGSGAAGHSVRWTAAVAGTQPGCKCVQPHPRKQRHRVAP